MLLQFDKPENLASTLATSRAISRVYQKSESGQFPADNKLVSAALDLANTVLPLTKDQLVEVSLDQLLKALEEPFGFSASDALSLGSISLAALDASLSILRSKIPKKQSPELREKIVMPLREGLKKF